MKGKDPAFLFYPESFLTGTMFMTHEQVGVYTRLLCIQHQKGYLTDSQIHQICDNDNMLKEVLLKFRQDKNGNYYNMRLREEMIKRKKHAQKQRENVLRRWYPDGDIPEEKSEVDYDWLNDEDDNKK
jgi:hypothetical protein